MTDMSLNPYQAPEVLRKPHIDLVRAERPGLAFFLSMICGSLIAFATPVIFLLTTGETALLKTILVMFTDLSSKSYRLTWAWVLVPGLLMGLNSSQIAQGRSAKHAAGINGLFLIAFPLLYVLVLGTSESWLYRCAIVAAVIQMFVAVTIGKACCASTHQSS